VPDAPHLRVLGAATEWLNSEPLGPAELRGHVVLVDFWTLTCINWLRTAPYVRAWSGHYRDDRLIVIGVHTPEFSFERRVELVRGAVDVRDIAYPVVLDNDDRSLEVCTQVYLADTTVGEGESQAVAAEMLDLAHVVGNAHESGSIGRSGRSVCARSQSAKLVKSRPSGT
jgi:thiol-disulfide isomerase/thioredoxin